MSNWYTIEGAKNRVAKTHVGGEVPNLELKINKKGYSNVTVFSDTHLGSVAFNKELFEWQLEEVDALKSYIILGGDIMEVALPSRIEQSVWEINMTTDDQYQTALKYFYPRRDRILFSTSGNHDARVHKKTGLDMARMLAKDLGCHYNKNGGYLKTRVGQNEYTWSIFHGHSGGINPFIELERRLVVYDDSDIIVMGNNHQLIHKQVVKKRVIDGNEERRMVHLIRSGSFMREPEYSREALYSPTVEGAPIIYLGGNDKKVFVDTSGETRW